MRITKVQHRLTKFYSPAQETGSSLLESPQQLFSRANVGCALCSENLLHLQIQSELPPKLPKQRTSFVPAHENPPLNHPAVGRCGKARGPASHGHHRGAVTDSLLLQPATGDQDK